MIISSKPKLTTIQYFIKTNLTFPISQTHFKQQYFVFDGVVLISLGVFKYNEVAGWGFVSVGLGFFAIGWVFNALKGRV
jgi:hypothetical protein